MRERPILFSAPMVRAILEGRKTQTRRVVKLQPASGVRLSPFVPSGLEDGHGYGLNCPYGVPGDRLWVRETHWRFTGCPPAWDGFVSPPSGNPYYARAYLGDPKLDDNLVSAGAAVIVPSIYMPRWASRILLEITEVRVQRLHEISEDCAVAEGVDTSPLTHEDINDIPKGIVRDVAWALGVGSRPSAKLAFQFLWDDLNDKRGFGWATNPWVWAITFRRVEQ